MFKRGMKARYVRIVLRARALRAPMKLFKWRKSSKKDYDLVSDDEYDPRIPLHPDEAFQYGITFHAKYIGTMDVPRPSSRVEIVAAMRRVRYEFKAQSVKKRKVTLDISTNGVRVTLRTKKKRKAKKFFTRKRKSSNARQTVELFHHPIYRIFYVSHDSSDLKIFSYIARDGSTNDFKCNVFKSSKKSQAMKIVRTVGQAFEVCHKMQNNSPWEPVPSTSSAPEPPMPVPAPAPAKASTHNCGSSETGGASTSKAGSGEPAYGRKKEGPKHLIVLPPPKKEGKRTRTTAGKADAAELPIAPGPPCPPCPPDLPECVGEIGAEVPLAPDIEEATPLSARHQLKLLREKLELQAQHTRVAVSQLRLVREQLAAEQAARCEAQARTHQLLLHNKELLEHIATLVAHLEERETKNIRPISAHHLTLLPQDTVKDAAKVETNGKRQQTADDLIDFALDNSATTSATAPATTAFVHDENVQNNNVDLAPFTLSPASEKAEELNLSNMTNEQLQDYLVKKLKSLSFLNGQVDPNDNDRQFYQNSRAFPDVPPLSDHFSNSDIVSLLNDQIYKDGAGSCDELSALAQAMSIDQSQNSLYSDGRDSSSSSKDSSSPDSSSEDGQPYIMPLSHAATLKATGEDGRVRLIVPVSPSGSSSKVIERNGDPSPSTTKQATGATKQSTAAPIARTTSERAPNKSELMAAIRAQWTRHTTK